MLYTFIDTETSGLEEDSDILSFSYMLADEYMNVKNAETLYFWKEGVTKWTEEAYAIHGLSKEFLRQHEDNYMTNLTKMYIALNYAIVTGYNSGWIGKDGLLKGFDYKRCKRLLSMNDFYEPKPLQFIDVMQICSGIYHKRRKLQSVFDERGLSRDLASAYSMVHFGDSGNAHMSSYDVVVTGMLFQQLYQEGYINDSDNNVLDYDIDIEHRDGDEWVLFMENDELKARNLYEDTTYNMADFMAKYPVIFDKIMKDPYTYFRQEV